MSKLLKFQIEKKLEFSHEAEINVQYLRSFSHYFEAYNIALAYLGKTDEDIRNKNFAWSRFLLNPDSVDSRRFRQLMNFVIANKIVIYECLDLIQKEKDEQGFQDGDFWRPDTIAIQSYEYPTE